jgi:hypothetical protein
MPLPENHCSTLFTTGYKRLTEGEHEAFCFCFGGFFALGAFLLWSFVLGLLGFGLFGEGGIWKGKEFLKGKGLLKGKCWREIAERKRIAKGKFLKVNC